MGVATFWAGLRSTYGQPREFDYSDPAASLMTAWQHGELWSPATFADNQRGAEHVQSVGMLVLDVDGKHGAVWSIDDAQRELGHYAGALHTTRSHTDAAHSFRVCLVLSREVSPAEHAKLWAWFDRKYPGKLDGQAKDASRMWYVPAHDADWRALTGLTTVDVDSTLAEPEPEPPKPPILATSLKRQPSGDRKLQRARDYVARMPPAIAGQGGHDATWSVALACAQGFGLSESDTLLMLHEYNHRCVPTWSDKDLRHKASQAYSKARVPTGYILDRDTVYRAPREHYLPTEEEQPSVGVLTFKALLEAAQERALADQSQSRIYALHPRLDDMLGGFRPGNVTVVGAPTNWGKSSFCVAVSDDALQSGKSILVISAEDVAGLYGLRYIARRTGMNSLHLRDGLLDERERTNMARIVAAAEPAPFFLYAGNNPVELVCHQIREIAKTRELDMVVCDYIQAFTSGKRCQDRRTEAAHIARELATAIKEVDAAGLLVSQLTRLKEKGEPGLHDLKESGDLENMAEHVLIAWTKGEDRDTERWIKVAKNKDGPKSSKGILLPWNDVSNSFITTPRRER